MVCGYPGSIGVGDFIVTNTDYVTLDEWLRAF